MSRRISPAFSDASYGRYASSDSAYRKTYLNRLPHVHKNQDYDSFQGTLTTANEAYGNYWASNDDARSEYTNGDAGYSDARSAPTIQRNTQRDREKYTSRNQMASTRDRQAGATSRHAAAARSKPAPSSGARDNGSLPPIRSNDRSSSKFGQSDRGRPPRRSWAKPPQKTGEQVKVTGKLPANFKISDVEHMTVELHTADGSIISIAAVPIFINSRQK